jgi:predicted dehydrogenase
MKGLVVGGGSIGKRHLQNLRALGIGELGLVEPEAERRCPISQELNARQFSALEAGLEWSPDFVVIATPSYLHLQQALEAVRRGCDLFVEKPLSHRQEGLAELCAEVESRKRVSLVGCNMRFHPGPSAVKKLLEQGSLGKILFARIHAGSYLPAWRPTTDYRDSYAAREETGGGCILDCIHEIDLARWYLGEVQEVLCIAGHLSSLEIATEDVAALVCRHRSGVISEIHLDYVQRTYERGCQIVGENGSVFWDFRCGQVRWYEASSDRWTNVDQPPNWQLNQMYMEEMRHFLECVRTRQRTTQPILEAVVVMQIVFASKSSAREGRLVPLVTEVSA